MAHLGSGSVHCSKLTFGRAGPPKMPHRVRPATAATAAGALGLRLVTAKVTTATEIEGAFAMLVGEGIGAVLIGGSLSLWTKQIIALVLLSQGTESQGHG